MKIVAGRTMAEIDRISIHERGVPSLALMERAGRAVACHFHNLCGNPETPVTVLCGAGNNGGDGFVIARRLLGWGYRPQVVLTHPPDKLSPDGAVNFDRYRSLPFGRWSQWGDPSSNEALEGNPVVIDALLGTGAHGAPRSPYSELIERTNEEAAWSLGVDIASGIEADTGRASGEAVSCRATVTFGLPKVGHFRRDGVDHTGALSVADIGFPSDLIENAEADAELITTNWVRNRIPRYPRSVHKGDRGSLLIVAGSARMLGAAILCARAAHKSGAGLVTLALPASLNAAAKGCLPEVMTLPLTETGEGELSAEAAGKVVEFAEGVDALAVGPGIGRTDAVRSVIKILVGTIRLPMVIDADGLFALSDEEGRNLLRGRTSPTVLTPHAGEFVRLAGPEGSSDFEEDSWKCCRGLAGALGATVLLKGPATLIAAPQETLLVNRTGHPAMAQGGMGDVLTGMIGTSLAEGLPPRDAAGVGAFIHGRAGEWAHREIGSRTVSAGETIENLAKAFREIG